MEERVSRLEMREMGFEEDKENIRGLGNRKEQFKLRPSNFQSTKPKSPKLRTKKNVSLIEMMNREKKYY